jgi:riboflavin kinase/FMN adenylyltransferase
MLDNKKTVIALGYFDCVHIGHQEVIKRAKEVSKSLDANLVVFSFDGNLKGAINSGDGTYIYNKEEREEKYYKLGADGVFFAQVDYNFLSMEKLAFLNFINKKFDIVAYVCGKDYKFGKFAKGNIDDLSKYAEEKGQKLFVVEDVKVDEKKISSTLIKKLLTDGKIKKVNSLLSENYSMTGEVVHGRKKGTELNFPTVNINIEKNRHNVKDGVYAGRVNVDGKEYKAVLNYGDRPTFFLKEKLLEGHIIGYKGDLYGKTLTFYFDGFIRDIMRFDSIEKLAERIKEDVKVAEDGKYD